MTEMVHGLYREGNDSHELIGALLRRPFLASRVAIVEDLRRAGFDDIQAAHLAVFQHPGPDGRSPSDVAGNAMVTKQAMNNLLGQLERSGYLRRVVNGSNRRERVVELTERGHDAIATIRRAVRDTEREWSAAMGDDAYRTLRDLLVDLNTHLEDLV